MNQDKRTFMKNFGLIIIFAIAASFAFILLTTVFVVILIVTLREHGNLYTELIIVATIFISIVPLISLALIIIFRKHFLGRITFSEEGIEWTCRKKRVKYLAWTDIADWNRSDFNRLGYTINLISNNNDSFKVIINKQIKDLMIRLCATNDKFAEWLKDYKARKELHNKNPSTTQDSNK